MADDPQHKTTERAARAAAISGLASAIGCARNNRHMAACLWRGNEPCHCRVATDAIADLAVIRMEAARATDA